MSAQRNELNLAFVDTLSCGLGAMIMLFVIFSVLPHLGTTASPSYPEQAGDRVPPVGVVESGDVVGPEVYALSVTVMSPGEEVGLRSNDPERVRVFRASVGAGRHRFIVAVLDEGITKGGAVVSRGGSPLVSWELSPLSVGAVRRVTTAAAFQVNGSCRLLDAQNAFVFSDANGLTAECT